MEENGEYSGDLVHHPHLHLWFTEMTKAEAMQGGGVFGRKEFAQPLLDQHAKRRSDKADDKTREPKDVHADIIVGDLERGRGGGRDIGGDEGAIREIDPVASRLCSDAFDRIDNPIGRCLLQIGVDGDHESGKDCGEKTCLWP